MNKVSIDPNCLSVPATQLQFACHRLDRGNGFAVIERIYWPPKKTDDDAFERLTIYFLSKPIEGQVIDLPSKSVKVFFSLGPSSFPGKHGCYGFVEAGKILVRSVSKSTVALKLSGSINLRSPLGWRGECTSRLLKKDLVARTIDFNNLNVWYGLKLKNNDIWNEAHP